MTYPPNVWNQLKNITADELISALRKDGWAQDETIGAVQVFYHSERKRRVTIHYHPQKTYQPKLLKAVLDTIGWDDKDFRKLKLIK